MNRSATTQFLLRWGVNSLGVLVASQVVPGIDYRTGAAVLVVAFILGLVNTFVRPLLTLLSLPLVVVTLGLFLWVINAALLGFVASLVRGFTISSFWSALGGAAVISIVSGVLSLMLGLQRQDPPRARRRPSPPPERPPGGQGPVIDV